MGGINKHFRNASFMKIWRGKLIHQINLDHLVNNHSGQGKDRQTPIKTEVNMIEADECR